MSAPHRYLGSVSGAVRASGNASLGVHGLVADNASAQELFIQLHNKATAPATSDVPAFTYRVEAGTSTIIDLDAVNALRGSFGTGLAYGWSSTRDTYNAWVTAADVSALLTLA